MPENETIVPTDSALRRAGDGINLNAAEAETLLHAWGEEPERLQAAASRVRDAGLEQAGRPGIITYSAASVEPWLDPRMLPHVRGPELEALAELADQMRADTVGDAVGYVVNRNINFTNVCSTGCRCCAFAQRHTDPDTYTLSEKTVAELEEKITAVGCTPAQRTTTYGTPTEGRRAAARKYAHLCYRATAKPLKGPA